jgi:hypothetical protein
LLNLSLISAEITNNQPITGRSIQENINISIQIKNTPPINILSPNNGTYLVNNLLFDFIIGSFEEILLNIDNGPNTTIVSPTGIFIPTGEHILNIYVRTSSQEYFESKLLTINPNLYKIIYTDYKNLTKGESTKIDQKTIKEIQKLNNLILENTNYGKIIFTEEINLMEDSTPEDNVTDLDANTKIEFNKIYVDTFNLANLNKSAILTLYNLPFNNPIILKDNSICPETICERISYSNNNLRFKVSRFSTYSAQESPKDTIIIPKSTAGRSTSDFQSIFTDSLTITPDLIHEKLRQGETINKKIKIKNNQNKETKINIDFGELKEFFSTNEKEITLQPNEEREVVLNITAKNDQNPQLYVGILKFILNKRAIPVWIMLEVESKNSLFDTYLSILNQDLILPGDTLLINAELFNLGDTEKIDANIKYTIESIFGEIISTKEETIAVKTKIELLELLEIPIDTKPGDYIIYLEINYDGRIAIASENFKIENNKDYSNQILIYSLIILILILILILTIFIILKKRKKKHYKSKKSKSRGR